MTDWTQILARLEPNQDGEQPVRHRSAVVDAVNSNGTVDLDFDGTVIPGVSVLSGAWIDPGATVQVAVWRGDLLVLGMTRGSDQDGPRGDIVERTDDNSRSATSSQGDLGAFATITITQSTARRYRWWFQGTLQLLLADTGNLGRVFLTDNLNNELVRISNIQADADGSSNVANITTNSYTENGVTNGSVTRKLRFDEAGTSVDFRVRGDLSLTRFWVEDVGAAI